MSVQHSETWFARQWRAVLSPMHQASSDASSWQSVCASFFTAHMPHIMCCTTAGRHSANQRRRPLRRFSRVCCTRPPCVLCHLLTASAVLLQGDILLVSRGDPLEHSHESVVVDRIFCVVLLAHGMFCYMFPYGNRLAECVCNIYHC
jgi:hypothetical protein